MDRFLQAAALAMVGAVLALVVQKQAKEISILMVIACSAVILALAAWFWSQWWILSRSFACWASWTEPR